MLREKTLELDGVDCVLGYLNSSCNVFCIFVLGEKPDDDSLPLSKPAVCVNS